MFVFVIVRVPTRHKKNRKTKESTMTREDRTNSPITVVVGRCFVGVVAFSFLFFHMCPKYAIGGICAYF